MKDVGNESEALARVFKALADPGRRVLLDALFTQGGQTLTMLVGRLDLSRQAVAKHLGLLEEAGLVVYVWQGREKLHYLNPAPLALIYERWIGKFTAVHLEALAEMARGLEGIDPREGEHP